MIAQNFLMTLRIIAMVTALLIAIEYIELKYKDGISRLLLGRPLRQCVIASLLGAIPGCLDAFLVVSLYIHGMVGFGALTAVMLSTAGDEAFIMLTMAPKAALAIFAINTVLGIIGGYLSNKIFERLRIDTSQICEITTHDEFSNAHFLKEHVYRHILRGHVPKLFFWIFIPLAAINLTMKYFDLTSLLSGFPLLLMIIIAALVGIIPESGPHMIFLILYTKGIVPFSVLLVSTLSQDGHGLLPLLSHSWKDTVYVQIFTTIFSLFIGILMILTT